MGKPSQEETKRNADLIRDYKSGKFNTVDLVSKYRISSARIYQIINREKNRITCSNNFGKDAKT